MKPGAFGAFLEAIRSPGRSYGPHPFWFWNDDLDEDELLRQLRAFYEHGVGGVVIHARVGLSRRIGYLTPKYFHLVRRAVETCAELGLKVILYDEGSYPSGSACGLVVESNPQYAARSLAAARLEIDGPALRYWRPSLGRALNDRVVCVVLGKVASSGPDGPVIDPNSLQALRPGERGLVRIETGPGRWLAVACIDTASGGRIRGVFADQEDREATAPPAGDLMNPDAVAEFIRITHDAYYECLADHFGTTVVALFTDEPNPLGRGAKAGVRPYTTGFESWFQAYLDREAPAFLAAIGGSATTWLPALWHDFGPMTKAFRAWYERAAQARVIDVFYRAQSDWCRSRGIALTGHPSESNDMASLATFDWPGQDMVWRWVTPGNESGLSGKDSAAAKAATSAARAGRRGRIVSELCGAYGWRHSMDEMKWLIDWHFARGNNLLFPHAYFYSVRGRRAYESEPDLGIHNVWWPYQKWINRYIGRMSWLLSDCRHLCDVAVLGPGEALPTGAARHLYTSQIDFLYVDEASLARSRVDASGRLCVGDQAYRAVVIDGLEHMGEAARQRLDDFRRAGGAVLVSGGEEGSQVPDWIGEVRSASAYTVDVRPVSGRLEDLRLMCVEKMGVLAYLLFNEGEGPITGKLGLSGRGIWYDAMWEETEPAVGGDDGMIPFRLERRTSRILLMRGTGEPHFSSAPAERAAPASVQIDVLGPWDVRYADGRPVPGLSLGDWCRHRDLELFSGALHYLCDVDLPTAARSVEIDLGAVGEIAEVWVNGVAAGIRLWSPYRLATSTDLWRPGRNRLEVKVTNSAANAFEGALLPSGLMGPVRLNVSS